MAKKNFNAKLKNKRTSSKSKHIKKKHGFKNTKMKFDVNARVVIRNLSFKTTEKNLKEHFEPFGDVVQVKLPKRPNGDLVGCGFVQYTYIDHAKLAISSRNLQPFLGRSIQVELAIDKNELVKNNNSTSQTDDNVEIKSEPESEENEIEAVPPLENKKNSAVNSNPRSNQSNRIIENSTESAETKKERIVKKARLIIRNIPFKATEETLKSHFSTYGEVLESVLLKKGNGELVGCGFIQFDNVQSATKAMLKTNSKPFMGRPIFVDWAVPKCKYMSFVTQKNDEEEYLKHEVKSEPESDTEEMDTSTVADKDILVKTESGDESDNKSDIDGDHSSDDDQDSDDEKVENSDGEENKDIEDTSNKRVSANDAEDGRTVFLRNLSFNATKEDLEQFANQFGEINYALVCVDKLTEHSKGTGFIRFKNKEDADMCYRAEPNQLNIQGQPVELLPALFRDRSKGKNPTIKKQPKDSRNLYLIKEGVILANTKAAVGVSATDMAKRLGLEQRKTEMLKNLNRFISRYRLTIHNVPQHYSDEDLRKVCLEMANVKPYALKECRIMKHMKGPMSLDGKYTSKGYGFVSFTKHESALTCLRRMNNNPNIFDKNNRPIVSFSIEDKSALNARKKRMEKSKLRNPLYKGYTPKTDNDNNAKNSETFSKDSKSISKKGNKFTKNNNKTKSANKKQSLQSNISDSKSIDHDEQPYAGEIGKPGKPLKMRNRHKLRMQVNMHKENVKQEKKQQKISKLSKQIKAKEKMKQPKQKMNTSEKKKTKKLAEKGEEKSFSDMVSKYKSKLVGNSSEIKLKSKWYEKK